MTGTYLPEGGGGTRSIHDGGIRLFGGVENLHPRCFSRSRDLSLILFRSFDRINQY